MTDRADIAAALDRMQNKFGTAREVRKLPGHLWEHERVDALAAGQYGKGQGLLVLTDRRLLFLFEGIMSATSEDFPFAKTSSVQWSGGVLMGTITIFASGNKAEIKSVNKYDGKAFVDMARNRLSTPSAPQPPSVTVQHATPQVDHMAALRQLGELHQAGVLTDEEFSAKKAEILSRL